MKNEDIVSVIVPVYNAEAYIEQCIRSVLKSDHSDWELLLIDDGSTDSSREICQIWEEKDKRIRLVSQKNGGPGKARNIGMEYAVGKFIMFLDSDDLLKQHAISSMLKKMDDTVDLVQCLSEKICGTAVALEEGPMEEKTVDSYTALKNYYSSSKPLVHYSVWGKLIRRAALADLRFFETKHSEDVIFTAQLIARCRNIYYIPEYLYSVVERRGSLSRSPMSQSIWVGKQLCADKMIELVESDSRFAELLPRAQWNKVSGGISCAYQFFNEKPENGKDMIREIAANLRQWFYRGEKTMHVKQKWICRLFCAFPTAFLQIYHIATKRAIQENKDERP